MQGGLRTLFINRQPTLKRQNKNDNHLLLFLSSRAVVNIRIRVFSLILSQNKKPCEVSRGHRNKKDLRRGARGGGHGSRGLLFARNKQPSETDLLYQIHIVLIKSF